MIDQIERDSDHIDFTGRRAVVPLHSRRNRGRGSIADGGQLPGAGKQSYLDAIIKVRENFQAISVTDGAVEASKSNEGAFVSILDAETKGAAVDMRKDMNRQVFGTGNGALCTKVSATTGVKSTSKLKKLEFLDKNSLQYLKIGDVVDVLIESTGATTNGVVGAEITAISIANKEVTLSKNLEAELAGETYNVYITGNRGNEMDGLRNITAENRTLHEVNSETAGNAFWNGQTLAVGTSLTETATAGESSFEQLGDKVGAQGNGDVEVWLTSRGIRRRLADSYQSQKRWTNKEATEIAGGYKAIMVNDVPVIIDDQCPKGFVFGFNKSAFKWFELSPPQWLELPDGKIFQMQQGATAGTWNAAYEAFFKWYVALGCVAPNRTGRLEFCSDDVPELSNS